MKERLKRYFGYNQNCIAVVTVLLGAIALWYILFSYPRTGMADFGEYDQTLYRMGLSRTETDLANPQERYFYRVIEEYVIDGVDGTRLFGQTPTESMVYPVALVSAVCNLAGVNFNTVYLAVLYCLITLCALYMIMKSLYGYFGNRVVFIPLLLALCFFNSDVIVPFNSLYSDGMIVASGILLVAVILRAMTKKEKRGIFSMLPVIGAAYLFLTAAGSLTFLIVILLPFLIYLICKCRPEPEKVLYYYTVSIIGVFLLTGMCLRFISDNEQLGNQMNLHSATFNGLFAAAEDKEEALAYFGLPTEYQEDIGKSYYLEEDAYVVAPYSEEAQEAIYSHISYGKIIGYYLSHPDTFVRLLDQNLAGTGRINRERYLYINRDGSSNPDVAVERMGYYPFIRGIIAPGSGGVLFVYFGILFTAVLGILIYKFIKRQDRSNCYLILMLMGLCMGSLFTTTVLYGNFENAFRMFPYMFLFDGLLITAAGSSVCLIGKMADFLEEKQTKVEEPAYALVESGQDGRIKTWVKAKIEWMNRNIWNVPRKAALMIGLFAGLVMFLVCFVPDRIGAYNNGDFGRMMDAMGLYYTDYDLLHQDEQYVTKVIEDYVWLDTFDWLSVTSFNPTMSQVFLAVFIRLTAGAAGLNYSTVYATVIYLVLMTISYIFLALGLHKLIGKKALWLTGALILVLFGSYNLGWFNSLFSEATEMAGFLMVLGSSLYLLAKQRGTVKWYEWLTLAACIRLFIGAKSQVTPEIMFWGIWEIALAFYHKPQPKDDEKASKLRQRIKWTVQIAAVAAMMLLTARSAVIIYQKDSEISSQDTTYSSIFSGVLMVANDPVEALSELGLDESLVEDKGKNPYLGDGAYYCQPRTEMAQEMIYSKVNTFDVLAWYLKHPDKLLYMLDHAAAQSAAKMPDYFLYVGEKTTQEHRTVSKFNLWGALRGSITPTYFWQYVLIYGAIIIICLRQVISKKVNPQKKMLAVFYIMVVLSAALQFPLSVIGNGFIDNIKQLFMFRLIHDIIITGAVFYAVVWVKQVLDHKTEALLYKTLSEQRKDVLTCDNK